MTVANTTSRNQYTATSGQTVFPYTFEIFDKGDIVVIQNTTTLAEGTNYTVSGVGNDNGGNITLLVGATAGDTITVYRDMAYQRETDYQTSGDFLAQEVNDDFDRLWLAVQQNEDSNSRAIQKPVTDLTSVNMTLPNATSRANRFLGFGSSGEVVTIASTGSAGEVADVKSYGADSTGVEDSTAAFQAAIDSGLAAVYIPSGTYKITSKVTINRDIMVYGDGPKSIIDTSSFPYEYSTENIVFLFTAEEPTLIETNSSSIIAGQKNYTFNNAHGLESGDLFAIWDDNDFSYSSARDNYYKGEFLTVVSSNGLDVDFFSGTFDAYGAGTAKLYKVPTISVTLKDFNMVGSSDQGPFRAIRMRLCKNSTVDNVNFINAGNYTNLELHNCYDVNITNCVSSISEYSDDVGNMYPIGVFNSQRIRIVSCSSRSRWHAIGVSASSLTPSIVCREVVIDSCSLTSEEGQYCGDFHGNVEHCTYVNCFATGSGFTLGGDYNSFVNNKIIDIQRELPGGGETDYAQSICFFGSEAVGYNFLIANNTYEASGSYVQQSFGKFLHIVKEDTPSHTGSLLVKDNNVLLLSEASPYKDPVILIKDDAPDAPNYPTNVNILIEGNSFYSKADPVEDLQNIRIFTEDLTSTHKFKSVVIRNNVMEKLGMDFDNIGELIVDGNLVTGSYSGIDIRDVDDLTFRNNVVRDSIKNGLYVENLNGDYAVISDNVFVNNHTDPALVGSGSKSSDIYLSTSLNMPYVRFSNNYIKCNGNPERALTYDEVYGLQEFNNRIDGTGTDRKVLHFTQDANGSAIFVGGESETTREFYHYGTSQTDFAVLTFDNSSNGSALVRLHFANTQPGYTGMIEFGLEGRTGIGVSTVNYRYTSTNDPVVSGKLIITTVGQQVTLSVNDVGASDGSHIKAEIIKGSRVTLLKSLDVKWLV